MSPPIWSMYLKYVLEGEKVREKAEEPLVFPFLLL
jgi:hypothetical protein